ncbi:MAG TPA: mandelate racemase/muconate lactonizing enzyme family protein [Bryobacteraceae bacterium]|nr:mandelate racemase/muconate lactonizing enzyme family protein [Bryobacteraceae bacterium]
MNRRNFLMSSAGAGMLAHPLTRALAAPGMESPLPDFSKPVFNLHRFFKNPVKIASIELLRSGRQYFVRTRSADGVTGIAQTKNVEEYIPILLKMVIPFYLGKDARDLETLVDGVYHANYKVAGQAFWCPVAYVEQSLFDLLGKTAEKPAAELMGGVLRKEIPVYLSGSQRDTTAEREVAIYTQGVEVTGAKTVKFKIGGRMSSNKDAYPGRTEKIIQLARKNLGGKVNLYADANGSYDAAKGIEVGKMLQDNGFVWFEEPCPWEELSETKKVADALSLKLAFGEQDSSLWLFYWMIQNRVMDVVQPDLNYNGGFVRAARVARMARNANNMWIVPHNTQTGAASVNIIHFAASTPNTGPFMEYAWRAPQKPQPWYSPNFIVKNGVLKLPTGPGLGLEFDPAFVKKLIPVKA